MNSAMTRRNLLGALLGAATLDPERLLWVPGAKVISIPKPLPHTRWKYGSYWDPKAMMYILRVEAGQLVNDGDQLVAYNGFPAFGQTLQEMANIAADRLNVRRIRVGDVEPGQMIVRPA